MTDRLGVIVPIGSTLHSTCGGKRVGSLNEGDPDPSPMVLGGDNPGLLGARLPILNSLPSFFPPASFSQTRAAASSSSAKDALPSTAGPVQVHSRKVAIATCFDF